MPETAKNDFERAARAALDAREASEILRQYQQGYGRPIISTEMDGFRLVAVGKVIKWSKNWRFFTDFLIDHLKDVIGRPWATQALREGKEHPIFTWLRTMGEIANAGRSTEKTAFQSNGKGHLGALWRLGYALYLIEHNDVLDRKIVKRLRSPATFRATYHETQIVSAFAVSGFKVKMAEIGRTSKSAPEFWASRGKGLRYAVEAKCKDRWKSHPDIESNEFQNELQQWIRDKIYASSLKKLENAVYCFELSLYADFSAEEWEIIASRIRDILKDAEEIKIKGQAPLPAYVMITNNIDVLGNEDFYANHVAMLFGFCRDDWLEKGSVVDIEFALDNHDKHKDVHMVFKCLEEIDLLPQSFDGYPTILDENGNDISINLKIGTRIEYPDAQGSPNAGVIVDVTSAGDTAWIIAESEEKHHIITAPLSEHEIEIVKKYGNAVFGKPEKKHRNLGGDPLKFYDWITSVYEKYDRKALLTQIKDHQRIGEFSQLSTDDLRIRAAREVTKAAHASSASREQAKAL